MANSTEETNEYVGHIEEDADGNYVAQCLEFPHGYFWTRETAPEWVKPGVGVRMIVKATFIKEEKQEPA